MGSGPEDFGPIPTTLEEALAENARLRAEVLALREANRRLEARLEELERRLGQNSQNSSQPPSSDPPWEPRPPKKPASGRRPGGQPGHKGHRRELVPPERVDEVVELWPERCEQCHADLPSTMRTEVGEAWIHQVTEIPESPARVTEYHGHCQHCDRCGHATPAEMPEGVPAGAFGPRLEAVAAACTGVYQLSKRQTAAMLGDLFDVPISTGSVVACEQRVSEAVAPPVAEARAYVEQQPVVHADETGWREARKRAWLWVAVTASVTVFLIHLRRSAEAMRKLLGAFKGVLVSDRWSAYTDHSGRRQLCWAHVIRYFVAFSERRGPAGKIGAALVEKTQQMFHLWHRVRDGTLARADFQQEVDKPEGLREAIEMLILQGQECGHAKVAATCRDLWKLHESLWTFVELEGVEPTNNAAENAIRAGVLLRKGSFGTHSTDGSRFIERMLTVTRTLRQQNRNVVAYLVETVQRARRGERAYSLLPGRPRLVDASYCQATP